MKKKQKIHEHLTLSEFRHKVGLPLVVVKQLVSRGIIKEVALIEGTIRISGKEIIRIRKAARNPWQRFRLFFHALGPGVITGASDDDPSGIGTYSSVGAHFGFALLWMAIWLMPMMMAVQEVCARIGIVTNHGLAGVLQRHYRKRVIMGAVVLLIAANIVNIGADLGAMAAALEMLTGIQFYTGAVSFALIIILLEIFVNYHTYVKVLKWLSVSVLAYVVVGFMIHPDWRLVFKEAFIPEIRFDQAYLFAMIAVFGTSITPYLFFWQASEEVEETKLLRKSEQKKSLHFRVDRMRTDVGTGMILANIVFFFIVLTSAQVLHQNGITEIQSAEQAALALKPLGQQAAAWLFAIGIIGTGLLAVPILAGSGAYALAEVMNWRESLELRFNRAKGFYLVIAISIVIGLVLNFLKINPISALYYSAYLNGVIALPLLIIIMIVGNDTKIMGKETHPRWVAVFGWAAIGMMFAAVLASILFALR